MDSILTSVKKLLGIDGQGKNGTVGYIYGHKERSCIETRNLRQPDELAACDHSASAWMALVLPQLFGPISTAG